MASRNPSFRLSSLTVWADLIEFQSLPACLAGDESADVLAAQEQASASRFAEVKCKLAADCQAMNAWNADKAKVASKQHVTRVLHEKAQLEQGKKFLGPRFFHRFDLFRLVSWFAIFVGQCFGSFLFEPLLQLSGGRVVDEFMQSNCWMGLVGDWAAPAEVDKLIRAAAAKNQVAADKVNIIGWIDLTKVGVLTQKDINKVGVWSEKLIAKHPVGILAQLFVTVFSLKNLFCSSLPSLI